MKYTSHNETSKITYISHETNCYNTLFTFHISITRQNRSKLIDSPTINLGTFTGLDLE